MYTGKQILEILLNSKRESSRICHKRPTIIENSSTFVIDLDSLKHPDDVKKDEFGRWVYNGSHVQTYLAWKKGDKLKFEKKSLLMVVRILFNCVGFAVSIPRTPCFNVF